MQGQGQNNSQHKPWKEISEFVVNNKYRQMEKELRLF